MGYNKKTLAKNTLFMYSRMFLSMLISLYSSRIILATLGVSDFGIFNIIGGVIVMFSFIHGSLSNSTQRYLNIVKGQGDFHEIRNVFHVCITNHVFIAICFFLIGESLGYPIVHSFLNLPIERIDAAYFVYHISLIITSISIIQIPFETTILAFEKHSVYAYMGLFDATVKLLIVYLLLVVNIDKLILFSILLFLVSLVTFTIYWNYVRIKIPSCTFGFRQDKNLMKQMFVFSGWTLFGSITELLSLSGINLLFNLFHGVIINAAYGVSNQVNSAVKNLVQGFKMSYTPQIIQTYSQGQYESLYNMIGFTSRVGFILFFIPAFFVALNAEPIFNLWLEETPPYSVSFCRVILLCTLIDSISSPYYDAITATGSINKYQICISISFLLDFVATFFFLYIGVDLSYILLCRFFTRGIINMIIGWYFLQKLIKFPLKEYIYNAFVPIATCMLAALLIFVAIRLFFFENIVIMNLCWLTISMIAPFVLFRSEERKSVLMFVKSKFSRY